MKSKFINHDGFISLLEGVIWKARPCYNQKELKNYVLCFPYPGLVDKNQYKQFGNRCTI